MSKRVVQLIAATLFLTTSALASVTATPPTPAAPVAVAEVPVPTANPVTPTAQNQPTIIPTAPNLNSTGYVLMDADTGMIIAHKNMHQKMQPASLTKLMTLYLTFNALKNGQIHLTDEVRVSKRAWQTGGSRMFIKEGSLVTVQNLIDGIIVASGNDACVALSQYVGGNESTFVDMMNAAAAQIGMKGTHYVDSTGLPQPTHHSTPYDMALLTRAIIENFPQYYPFFKQGWITYNGIKQPNRNRLLWRDTTVDGLKTGHTEEAGYCLISSALRKGMRLISIVMGAPTDAERASDSEALLNWGFRFYSTHKLFEGNKALANPRVWLGESKTVPVGLASPMYVTIQHGIYSHLQPQVVMNAKLNAPIKKGEAVGTLNILLHNTVIATAPLVALKDDLKGGIISRVWDHVAMHI
ncbi:MAG: D-alanyl-D-alanine carboxypeptidase [Gammaproteobacteria bacterium]|nr:D-alanyl-D-alanine carboxypeptidase [Gammaproteobacteria bacterium]